MCTCVFCGVRDPANHKLLNHSYVSRLLQTQIDAGVAEPVVNLMRGLIAQGDCAREAALAPDGEGGANAECADSSSSCAGGEEPQLMSCMCCYYWVERRADMQVVPLPMQNLLWFVRVLGWCEGTKCDSRILQRLVETVTEPGNVFAELFDSSELLGLRHVAQQQRAAQARVKACKEQGTQRFCVKRALAALWSDENASCLCLPHSAAADWLR